ASQRWRRNSPAFVPSQKCWVSGVGFGRARCGSAMSASPPEGRASRSAVSILLRQLTIGRQRSSNARACHHAHNACIGVRQRDRLRGAKIFRETDMPDFPTLATLAADLDNGRTTSRKLVEECLARIADPAGEGRRAFIHVDKAAALAAADAMDGLRKVNA